MATVPQWDTPSPLGGGMGSCSSLCPPTRWDEGTDVLGLAGARC